MVQAITGFRPYVSAVPPITQQQRVNQIKLERNELTDELRNGKISELQAMAEKTSLDSKLSEAKAHVTTPYAVYEPVEVKPSKFNYVTKPQEVQPANIRAMDRQQKGQELTKAEKEQLVENQMKQMAINNQVLHGLVAM